MLAAAVFERQRVGRQRVAGGNVAGARVGPARRVRAILLEHRAVGAAGYDATVMFQPVLVPLLVTAKWFSVLVVVLVCCWPLSVIADRVPRAGAVLNVSVVDDRRCRPDANIASIGRNQRERRATDPDSRDRGHFRGGESLGAGRGGLRVAGRGELLLTPPPRRYRALDELLRGCRLDRRCARDLDRRVGELRIARQMLVEVVLEGGGRGAGWSRGRSQAARSSRVRRSGRSCAGAAALPPPPHGQAAVTRHEQDAHRTCAVGAE